MKDIEAFAEVNTRVQALCLEARHTISRAIAKKRRQEFESSIFIPKEYSRNISPFRMAVEDEKTKSKRESYKQRFKTFNTPYGRRSNELSDRKRLEHPESFPLSKKTAKKQVRPAVESFRGISIDIRTNGSTITISDTSLLTPGTPNFVFSFVNNAEAQEQQQQNKECCEQERPTKMEWKPKLEPPPALEQPPTLDPEPEPQPKTEPQAEPEPAQEAEVESQPELTTIKQESNGTETLDTWYYFWKLEPPSALEPPPILDPEPEPQPKTEPQAEPEPAHEAEAKPQPELTTIKQESNGTETLDTWYYFNEDGEETVGKDCSRKRLCAIIAQECKTTEAEFAQICKNENVAQSILAKKEEPKECVCACTQTDCPNRVNLSSIRSATSSSTESAESDESQRPSQTQSVQTVLSRFEANARFDMRQQCACLCGPDSLRNTQTENQTAPEQNWQQTPNRGSLFPYPFCCPNTGPYYGCGCGGPPVPPMLLSLFGPPGMQTMQSVPPSNQQLYQNPTSRSTSQRSIRYDGNHGQSFNYVSQDSRFVRNEQPSSRGSPQSCRSTKDNNPYTLTSNASSLGQSYTNSYKSSLRQNQRCYKSSPAPPNVLRASFEQPTPMQTPMEMLMSMPMSMPMPSSMPIRTPMPMSMPMRTPMQMPMRTPMSMPMPVPMSSILSNRSHMAGRGSMSGPQMIDSMSPMNPMNPMNPMHAMNPMNSMHAMIPPHPMNLNPPWAAACYSANPYFSNMCPSYQNPWALSGRYAGYPFGFEPFYNPMAAAGRNFTPSAMPD